ncbi:MAG: hypothetical protein QOH27_1102 [Mycobacterium sp.]|jgi:uncharacterized protein YdeI (YjbR/CyaY-like superfamily)|nr:hypothetical protein [Mycobacterium sp.]
MTDQDVLDVRSPRQWEEWLEHNHDTVTEVWLRLFNKAAGEVPVSYGEAVEIALCFGWIDSLARGHDEVSRIQRFSPRKAKSAWSKSNVERVQRLLDAGRMRTPGLRQIDAARADGRWPTS